MGFDRVRSNLRLEDTGIVGNKNILCSDGPRLQIYFHEETGGFRLRYDYDAYKIDISQIDTLLRNLYTNRYIYEGLEKVA